MPFIDEQELRERTEEVLRHVWEDRAEYLVALDGQVVARLIPVPFERVEPALMQAANVAAAEAWAAYTRVAGRLRDTWPAHVSTQALLDEIRASEHNHDH